MKKIPANWVLSTVGEITLPVSKVEATGSEDREIQYIDIGSIDNQRNRIADPKRVTLSSAPSRARQVVKSGDVLFATVRPYLRNIAQVPVSLDSEIASTGFAVLRPAEGVDPGYLYYKAISQDFVSALTGEQYGVSYPAVKDDQVCAQPFELPPTHEQRRIVAKIEELFSELDKGVENLTVARDQLKAYRRSVLKAAFDGKLTENWRAKNADKLEAPETLLAQIKVEREARYKQAFDDWQSDLADWRAKGEKGRKPEKPKRPDWPKAIDTSGLRPLAEGWTYLPFGALAWSIRNGISAKPDEVGSLKIFRISAVRPMRFDLSDYRLITDADGTMQSYRLRFGDLVFTRYNGSRDYVGVCAMYRGDGSHVYPDKLIRCELRSSLLNPQFLEAALNSGESRSFLERRIRTTAGQSGVSGGDIKSIPAPVCSIAEQSEIVRILEEKLEATDVIEAEIEAGLARAEALRQSILKCAFSGKLVAQDAADEPAFVLLERIRAQREGSGWKQRRNNKNAKTEAA